MKQRIRFGKRACCVAATMCVAAAAFLLPTNGSAGASTVKGSTYELYYTDTGATPAGKYLPAISNAINASGGINGHPLKIVDCDDQGNSNQATQCAQQATSNPTFWGSLATLLLADHSCFRPWRAPIWPRSATNISARKTSSHHKCFRSAPDRWTRLRAQLLG